jgi:prevent-host-death family protein
MNRVSVTQFKEDLSEYLDRAAYGQERIVIVSRGQPKAAVIGIQDLEHLEELEDALAAQEALAEYGHGKTISLTELIAELEARADDVSNRNQPPGALGAG